MALVALSRLLADARAGGYAIGYFEAWDTVSLEAVVEAAQAERAPVVLGFGGMMMDQDWLDRFGIEPLGAYGRAVAERLDVPAALILNEVWEMDHARRGVHAGFNTVMLNTCHLPYDENLRLTHELVAYAHPHGVEVQAELGRLPNFGEAAAGTLTDPDQARAFVTETDVDFLAVSIGNMHLRTEGKDTVDLDRLRAIRAAVDVPLVIHGGSGFPPEVMGEVIAGGVALFHVGTVMKMNYLLAARQALEAAGERPDVQAAVGSRKAADFLTPAKAAVRESVRAFMRQIQCSGKAA